MAYRVTRLLSRQVKTLAERPTTPGSVYVATQRYSSSAAVEEDDIVKQTFVEQQTKLRSFLSALTKSKIPVTPEDPKVVQEYVGTLKKIKADLGIPSATEKLSGLLELAAEDSDSVRGFLETAKSLRDELSIPDSIGADKLMFEALDSVEKKIGKPLVSDDSKGMQLWAEAVKGVNSKLGLSESDLEKLEEEAELDIVKADLTSYKEQAEETIRTYKRRDGLESINIDLKEVDPRPYL